MGSSDVDERVTGLEQISAGRTGQETRANCAADILFLKTSPCYYMEHFWSGHQIFNQNLILIYNYLQTFNWIAAHLVISYISDRVLSTELLYNINHFLISVILDVKKRKDRTHTHTKKISMKQHVNNLLFNFHRHKGK